MSATEPASLAPQSLAGLDPAWSRLVTALDGDGVERTWHVLDNGAPSTIGTVLCVHGNPTWSYLWRGLLADAPAGWRVVAIDHLDMGFSERTGSVRRLDRRIDDLGRLTDALGITGPVVTVAHDWGGPISLGWAMRHREQVQGIVLTNTAVGQPETVPMPPVIRLARTPSLIERVCVDSSIFVRSAALLSRPAPPKDVRDAYLAPYRSPERRAAVGGFVEDIPMEADHPSTSTLAAIADGLSLFADTPTLLLWGPSDPVFSEAFLTDLSERLPHADVHRFPGASHLVIEDADTTGAIVTWLNDLSGDGPSTTVGPAVSARQRARLWAELDRRRDDSSTAVAEMTRDGVRRVSFADLSADVRALAAGLVAHGAAPGQRVAVLVTPGIDLATVIYACWRMGAVAVLVDGGLGPKAMDRAVRGARPDHVIAIPKGMAAARALRWPGSRIVVGVDERLTRRALAADVTLDDLKALGRDLAAPPEPGRDADAAVVFTSGATGPSKGVVYTHAQIEAQRDAVADTYGITGDDRLVAAFAPFALYGPALGIASIVPDMDVSAPGTLTAQSLVSAIAAVDATLVFASPAALTSVLTTVDEPSVVWEPDSSSVRLLLSAGAPVRADTLRASASWLGGCDAHTPYGMSEVLPVADISLAELDQVAPGDGVCVGHPIDDVEVMIVPLDLNGVPAGARSSDPDVTGEVCVRADHVRDRYDRLWHTQRLSADGDRWHRTGDVGHLDHHGRLWIEGRLSHVITTPDGPVTPVQLEAAAETLPEVQLAAAVGVGPPGTQQVAVVVELAASAVDEGLADQALTDAVRQAVGAASTNPPDVAAVLVIDAMPVDRRHNSKVDRSQVARWTTRVLGGHSARSRRLPERLVGRSKSLVDRAAAQLATFRAR